MNCFMKAFERIANGWGRTIFSFLVCLLPKLSVNNKEKHITNLLAKNFQKDINTETNKNTRAHPPIHPIHITKANMIVPCAAPKFHQLHDTYEFPTDEYTIHKRYVDNSNRCRSVM